MQHKFLLRFIKEEMLRQKISFKNNEAFFRLFLDNEPWESYRSNMSNWLSPNTKDGVIHKYLFITAINEKLTLNSSLWGASDEKQKVEVIKGVSTFKKDLEAQLLLFPWVDEVDMSQEEEEFIDLASTATLKEIEEKKVHINESFKKTSKNQKFLIALFECMYKKGEYMFVYRHIFPYLLDSYDNAIKSKKAHIYASLPKPMYREAFDILNSIKGESKTETIDLQTSAISNIRRERLSSSLLTKESLKGLLKTFILCYRKIYVPKQAYSYYTGINLAYIISLAGTLFPDESLAEGYSVQHIYMDVQQSILKDKASKDSSENYYASMSALEFGLLMHKKNLSYELENILETLAPSTYLVDQTRRQMGTFFFDIVQNFSEEKVQEFTEAKVLLEVFDAYKKYKKF